MKKILIVLLAVGLSAAVLAVVTRAAAPTPAIKDQLKALVDKIRAKLDKGASTEEELAPELAQFDAILAAHKGEKTDDAAQVLLTKGMLYVDLLRDPETALLSFEKLKTDYPATVPGVQADRLIEQVKKMVPDAQIRKALVVGSKFPDFNVNDSQGHPISVASRGGKVVMLDFWATWCKPCMDELPNVISVYEKYHAKGFEIISVSLDDSDDEKKFKAFVQDKKMTWPQIYDGKEWNTELAKKYGVDGIPYTILVGGDGKILGKDLRGEALEKAVAAAVAK